MDERGQLLVELIAAVRAEHAALPEGEGAFESAGAAREALVARLRALDQRGPPASEAHRDALERLRVETEALTKAVGASLRDTQQRLRDLSRGRRGLTGYRDAATGGDDESRSRLARG